MPVEPAQRRRSARERREVDAGNRAGDRVERGDRARQFGGKIDREALREVDVHRLLGVAHRRLQLPSSTWRVPLPIKPDPTTDTSNRRETQQYTDGLIE